VLRRLVNRSFGRRLIGSETMNILLVGYGYLGSFLRPRLEDAGHRVAVCDHGAGRLAGVTTAISAPYQALTQGDLSEFEAILWFAGHSGVGRSSNDPHGAVANNCFDLLTLAQRKSAATRLIYASSASVYSVFHANPHWAPPTLAESDARLAPTNAYDASKAAFEALAPAFTDNCTGLRLGTVSGCGPRLRRDLVFNAMNLSAVEHGHVVLANGHAHRTILFLDDLAYYVLQLLALPAALPSVLNVGSFNLSIAELAFRIASFYKVPVVAAPDSPTYSFRMDWEKLRSLAGSPVALSLEARCEQFRLAVREHP
jgi:nucleoside-diphosphate-sugar epimerase